MPSKAKISEAKLGKECVCSKSQPTDKQDERRTPNAQKRIDTIGDDPDALYIR
jgi:hypothetical protein